MMLINNDDDWWWLWKCAVVIRWWWWWCSRSSSVQLSAMLNVPVQKAPKALQRSQLMARMIVMMMVIAIRGNIITSTSWSSTTSSPLVTPPLQTLHRWHFLGGLPAWSPLLKALPLSFLKPSQMHPFVIRNHYEQMSNSDPLLWPLLPRTIDNQFCDYP